MNLIRQYSFTRQKFDIEVQGIGQKDSATAILQGWIFSHLFNFGMMHGFSAEVFPGNEEAIRITLTNSVIITFICNALAIPDSSQFKWEINAQVSPKFENTNSAAWAKSQKLAMDALDKIEMALKTDIHVQNLDIMELGASNASQSVSYKKI